MASGARFERDRTDETASPLNPLQGDIATYLRCEYGKWHLPL
jgi:hypothetical protein